LSKLRIEGIWFQIHQFQTRSIHQFRNIPPFPCDATDGHWRCVAQVAIFV